MAGLFVKKNLTQLIAEAGDPNAKEGGHGGGGPALRRHLTAVNLTMLGIGAVIGAGIFSLTGTASANYAGPGIVFSFAIGGVLCALAGLCYSEMAAMVPVSGSAYAYAYATMGEFVAWIIGWDLVLEYAFGAVTVATSWSGYFYSLLRKTLGLDLPDGLVRLTKGPWENVTLNDGSTAHGLWNLPASFIALVIAAVLYRGIKESARVNNVIVVVKVAIVLSFIGLGWAVVSSSNWVADAAASGVSSLVPPRSEILVEGKRQLAYGWPGVLTGAGVVFFAYVGFDAISTTAQECVNPRRDLPIGIFASLFICTALYIMIALVLTGIVPYKSLGVPDPVAVGIDRIVELRGWSPANRVGFTFVVKLGALAGLTSVILVMMLGQTRIFYAMARDGLLPWFSSIHAKFGTPHVATSLTGVFVALCAGLMPMSLVGELVSIGTLLAFVLVCIGIPILRVTSPDIPRPFRMPAAWVVAPLGALACLWVMSGLPGDTWLRLIVWLVIGLAVYFGYGRKNSRLRNQPDEPAGAALAAPPAE
ncbi:MAG TPA: amino acid permease [Polyangiaceae bacterium]|nr:amino acid permease [Polyangiaceae bacterium]